MKISSCAIN